MEAANHLFDAGPDGVRHTDQAEPREPSVISMLCFDLVNVTVCHPDHSQCRPGHAVVLDFNTLPVLLSEGQELALPHLPRAHSEHFQRAAFDGHKERRGRALGASLTGSVQGAHEVAVFGTQGDLDDGIVCPQLDRVDLDAEG